MMYIFLVVINYHSKVFILFDETAQSGDESSIVANKAHVFRYSSGITHRCNRCTSHGSCKYVFSVEVTLGARSYVQNDNFVSSCVRHCVPTWIRDATTFDETRTVIDCTNEILPREISNSSIGRIGSCVWSGSYTLIPVVLSNEDRELNIAKEDILPSDVHCLTLSTTPALEAGTIKRVDHHCVFKEDIGNIRDLAIFAKGSYRQPMTTFAVVVFRVHICGTLVDCDAVVTVNDTITLEEDVDTRDVEAISVERESRGTGAGLNPVIQGLDVASA